MPQYEIVAYRGRYIVYVEGKYFCMADSVTKAIKEIERRFG